MASTNDKKGKKGPPPNKNSRANKVDDMDLGIGDFDFGLDEFDFKPEKDNRKPTTKLAAGMYEGAKSTVSDKHFIEDFIKRALPDGYGQAFNVADSTWSSTKDLYNSAATEMRAPLKEIQRSSKKLLASVENVIPEKIYSRIDKLLTEKESYFDNARSDEERRKEADDREINTQLGEIFKENLKASESIYAHQKVDKTIREKIEDDQHSNQLLQLETTRAGIDRMVAFQDNFTARYQRKSLELQFKQLFMMRDLTDVTIKSSELSNKFLESITKNTALPDAVKIKTAEVNRQMLKQRLIGGVQNKASEYVRGFGKQLKSNVQNVMSTYTRQMMDGFNMGRQLAESMESAKEFGDTGGPHEMIGGMVGGELAEQAGYRVAQFFSKITDQMPELKRGGSALKYFTTGIPEMFNELAQRGTTQTGWKGSMARLAQQLIPTHMLNSSLGDSPILDSDTHSGFTNGANRALIEVIPGYLSRILHAQRVMMSKNPNIKRVVYNADRGAFTTKDDAVKDAAWRMFGEANTTGARNSLDEFVRSVAGNTALSPEASGALKDQLMRDSLGARTWSADNYTNKEYFDEKLAPQVRQEIADVFSQALGMGQGEKFDFRVHDINRAAKLREKYTAMRNNFDDPREKTKGYIEAGQRELMEALGLIEKGGLTGRMNYNEAFRRTRDASASIDYPDEVWELAEETGVPVQLVAKVVMPSNPAPIGAASPPPRATINSGRRTRVSKRRQKIIDQRSIEAAEPPAGVGSNKVNARDMLTSINESVTGEGELITAVRANNITGQATATVELLSDIREMLASGQFGGGGGSGGPPPIPGGYSRRKGFWGGTEHAFRWIGGKLVAGGKLAGQGAGMAWRGGKGAGSFLGRTLGGLANAAWGGAKSAAGIGWAAGANAAEGALNYISDVRDKQGRVLLEARLLRLGQYFDVGTGKVITKLSDIRGPVKDAAGNVVLTAYDFGQQLYNSNGQRILAGLTAGGRGFLKALGWTSTAPFRAGNFIRNTVNGALARMDADKDIYVRGEPQAPRLLAIKMKAGQYFVQDGMTGTKVVMSWRDCTNTVMDSDGNIVLTTDDIKRGLVDVNGMPFGLTIGGRIGHVAVNVALGIASRLSKFTQWAVKAPKRLMDFLSGVRLDSITNVFVGVGSYIGDQLQNQLDVQNKQLNVLQNIYELLDQRLPKPVFGDTDGDGLRDGSWQEKEKNGDGSDGDTRDRPSHTGKASSKDNIVANMFGIGGKVKGLWDKLFGKKGGGGGGDGDCDCNCCGCDGGDGGGDFYVDADGRKKRRSRAPGRDTKGRRRGGWRRNRAARAARSRRRRGLPARARTGATPRVVRPPPLPGARRAPGFARRTLGRFGRFRPRGASVGGIAAGVAMGLGGGYLVDKLGGDDSTGGKVVNGVADTAGMVSTGLMATSAVSALTGGGATAAAGTAAAAGGVSAGGAVAGTAGAGLMATIGLPVLIGAAVVGAVGYVGYKAWKKYKYGTYIPVRAFRMAQYGVPYGEASDVEKIVDFEQMVAPHTKMVNGQLDISSEKLSMEEVYKHFGLDDGWFTNNQEERNLLDVWLTRRFKPVYLTWFQAMKAIAPTINLNDADDELDQDKKVELVKAGSKVNSQVYSSMAGPFGEPLKIAAADVDRSMTLALARIEKDRSGVGGFMSGAKRLSDASMALAPGMSMMTSPLNDWMDRRQEDADIADAKRKAEMADKVPGVPVGSAATGFRGATEGKPTAGFDANGKPIASVGGLTVGGGYMNMQYKPGQGMMSAPPMAPIMLNGTMQLVLDREASDLDGTYGTLKLPDGTVFQTLELPWKDNASRVSCIPTGVYKCAKRQTSSFGQAYEVYGVPGRSAILIHAGNSAGSAEHGKKADSQGCILLGLGRARLGNQKSITNSQAAMKLFYEKMAARPFQLAIIGGMACLDPNAVREANQNKQANSAYNTTPAQATADSAAAAARTAASGASAGNASASTPYSYMNTAYQPGSGMGVGGAPAMMNMGYGAGNYSNPSPVGQTVDHPGNGTGGNVNDLPTPPPGAVGAKAIGPLIIAAAKMAGVDPKLMMTMASIESGFRPQVGAGTSSAKGLYQFINSTWKSMLNKYGAKYGISPDAHQFDARANALMGAEFLKENAAQLRKSVGREPTDTDLYMAHFMGAGGAVSALRSPAEAIGAQAMPAAASANRNIYFERDGRPKTMGGVIAHLDKLVRGHRYGASDIAAIGAGSFNSRTGDGSTGQAATYTASAMPVSATGAPNPALAMAGAPPAGANATPREFVEAPRPSNPAYNDQGAGGTGLVTAGTTNSDPQGQMQQAAFRQSYEADVNSRAVQSAQTAQTGGVMEIMNRQLYVMKSMEGHLRDISTKMGNNPAALNMPAQSSEAAPAEATPAAPPPKAVERDGLMVQQSTRAKREAARRQANLNAESNSTPVVDFGLRSDVA